MRVMTYNLKGLHLSQAAAIEVVREHAPDVLGVQEPPRGLFGVARMRRFGSAVGMVPVVSGDGARTTALLVRPGLPVSSPRAIRLPWRPRPTTSARAIRLPWPPGAPRRGAAVAVVAGVTVVVVHLSLVRTERAQHLELLL